MNKTTITNIISLLVSIIGYIIGSDMFLMMGLFALSGSITNTLAIHMLFERVPFLYGSGVIEEKFESFKLSISSLIMNQFFTKEHIKKFINDEMKENQIEDKLVHLIQNTNFEPSFDALKMAIIESPFGGMLGMFGGEKALEPLKEPFQLKLQTSIIKIVQSDSFTIMAKKILQSDSIDEQIVQHIEVIVNARLEELSPKMVKEIIQNVIYEHLGWLVIWGGIFGGLIGLITSILMGGAVLG